MWSLSHCPHGVPRWIRKYAAFQRIRQPQEVEQVIPLMERVFGGRLRYGSATSHELHIAVVELRDLPKFRFGLLSIPIKGGQKIKARYLQLAYEAAVLLKLFPPRSVEEDDDGEESIDQAN